MIGQIYNLDHDFFESLCPGVIKSLSDDELFSDVSLIAEDGVRIKAHRNIVASFSETLRKILEKNTIRNGNDFSIYLLDIDSNILRNLKNFIYLGKAEIPSERLDKFLKAGTKLRIKGLTQQEDSVDISEDESEIEMEGNCSTEVNYASEKLSETQKGIVNNDSFIRL